MKEFKTLILLSFEHLVGGADGRVVLLDMMCAVRICRYHFIDSLISLSGILDDECANIFANLFLVLHYITIPDQFLVFEVPLDRWFRISVAHTFE